MSEHKSVPAISLYWVVGGILALLFFLIGIGIGIGWSFPPDSRAAQRPPVSGSLLPVPGTCFDTFSARPSDEH